jgi:hypothetical protein
MLVSLAKREQFFSFQALSKNENIPPFESETNINT